MDKIYFPIEKTVFLPREKAPIGKMEQVTTKAKIDAIEPAQTGWLCYGKLLIDLTYTPMGTGREKHQEQWKQVSQQLLAMGKEAKESCSIIVDFIQELPDRDFTYGCEFDADVQKKTWQQIASNALEIGVDIALSVREKQKKTMQDMAEAQDHCMVLEQDSFSLEEKKADPTRTKKATAQEPEELYYYADEEGCAMTNLDSNEDTLVFCPTEPAEEKKDNCHYPVDFTQKELCPTEEGTGSKGQHLLGKHDEDKKTDCPIEMTLEGDMAFQANCPAEHEKEKKTEPKETDHVDCCLEENEEAAPCLAERKAEITEKMMEMEMEKETLIITNTTENNAAPAEKPTDTVDTAHETEEVCVNEEMVLETAPLPTDDNTDDACEVVPLPLPGKEKHHFWKGKRDKKGDFSLSDLPDMSDMTPPFSAAPAEKPAEPKKGYRLKFYVVQGGEDLAAIAEKHSVSPDSILAANKNISEEDIRTGMVLSIPM